MKISLLKKQYHSWGNKKSQYITFTFTNRSFEVLCQQIYSNPGVFHSRKAGPVSRVPAFLLYTILLQPVISRKKLYFFCHP